MVVDWYFVLSVCCQNEFSKPCLYSASRQTQFHPALGFHLARGQEKTLAAANILYSTVFLLQTKHMVKQNNCAWPSEIKFSFRSWLPRYLLIWDLHKGLRTCLLCQEPSLSPRSLSFSHRCHQSLPKASSFLELLSVIFFFNILWEILLTGVAHNSKILFQRRSPRRDRVRQLGTDGEEGFSGKTGKVETTRVHWWVNQQRAV